MRLKLSDKQLCGLLHLGVNTSELCAYKWLYNKRAIGKKITVYYSDFNKWLYNATRGLKSFSDKHAGRLLENLGKLGLAEVEKKGFGRFEVTLFSIDFALGHESQKETNLSEDEKRSNKEPVGGQKELQENKRAFQQQLILAKRLLAEIGVNYREEKVWWEIAAHGLEKIEATIEYFKFKMRMNPGCIYNPPGWIRRALSRDYYLTFNPPSSGIERFINLFVPTYG